MPLSSLKSVTGTSYCTVITAVAPSLLTTGGATWETWSTVSDSRSRVASRALGSRVPLSVWTTTRASAPAKAGNLSCSRS